jgi:hypothetical protein
MVFEGLLPSLPPPLKKKKPNLSQELNPNLESAPQVYAILVDLSKLRQSMASVSGDG